MATAPPAPPKAPPPSGRNTTKRQPSKPLEVTTGIQNAAQRIGIYGEGGIGKSELASLLSQVGIKPLYIDLQGGSRRLDVSRIEPQTFEELRGVLQGDVEFDAVVVDTMSNAEDMAKQWMLENVPHEKGKRISSIEDYGYGKGYVYLHEIFLLLLSDMDSLIRKGKHVICIAHDCTAKVPNASADDYLRYEPLLQSTEKAKTRSCFKNWLDHLFFIQMDIHVTDGGKAQGSGSRTIYPSAMPTFWAKSRDLADQIPYARGDAELWRQLLGEKTNG